MSGKPGVESPPIVLEQGDGRGGDGSVTSTAVEKASALLETQQKRDQLIGLLVGYGLITEQAPAKKYKAFANVYAGSDSWPAGCPTDFKGLLDYLVGKQPKEIESIAAAMKAVAEASAAPAAPVPAELPATDIPNVEPEAETPVTHLTESEQLRELKLVISLANRDKIFLLATQSIHQKVALAALEHYIGREPQSIPAVAIESIHESVANKALDYLQEKNLQYEIQGVAIRSVHESVAINALDYLIRKDYVAGIKAIAQESIYESVKNKAYVWLDEKGMTVVKPANSETPEPPFDPREIIDQRSRVGLGEFITLIAYKLPNLNEEQSLELVEALKTADYWRERALSIVAINSQHASARAQATEALILTSDWITLGSIVEQSSNDDTRKQAIDALSAAKQWGELGSVAILSEYADTRTQAVTALSAAEQWSELESVASSTYSPEDTRALANEALKARDGETPAPVTNIKAKSGLDALFEGVDPSSLPPTNAVKSGLAALFEEDEAPATFPAHAEIAVRTADPAGAELPEAREQELLKLWAKEVGGCDKPNMDDLNCIRPLLEQVKDGDKTWFALFVDCKVLFSQEVDGSGTNRIASIVVGKGVNKLPDGFKLPEALKIFLVSDFEQCPGGLVLPNTLEELGIGATRSWPDGLQAPESLLAVWIGSRKYKKAKFSDIPGFPKDFGASITKDSAPVALRNDAESPNPADSSVLESLQALETKLILKPLEITAVESDWQQQGETQTFKFDGTDDNYDQAADINDKEEGYVGQYGLQVLIDGASNGLTTFWLWQANKPDTRQMYFATANPGNRPDVFLPRANQSYKLEFGYWDKKFAIVLSFKRLTPHANGVGLSEIQMESTVYRLPKEEAAPDGRVLDTGKRFGSSDKEAKETTGERIDQISRVENTDELSAMINGMNEYELVAVIEAAAKGRADSVLSAIGCSTTNEKVGLACIEAIAQITTGGERGDWIVEFGLDDIIQKSPVESVRKAANALFRDISERVSASVDVVAEGGATPVWLERIKALASSQFWLKRLKSLSAFVGKKSRLSRANEVVQTVESFGDLLNPAERAAYPYYDQLVNFIDFNQLNVGDVIHIETMDDNGLATYVVRVTAVRATEDTQTIGSIAVEPIDNIPLRGAWRKALGRLRGGSGQPEPRALRGYLEVGGSVAGMDGEVSNLMVSRKDGRKKFEKLTDASQIEHDVLLQQINTIHLRLGEFVHVLTASGSRYVFEVTELLPLGVLVKYYSGPDSLKEAEGGLWTSSNSSEPRVIKIDDVVQIGYAHTTPVKGLLVSSEGDGNRFDSLFAGVADSAAAAAPTPEPASEPTHSAALESSADSQPSEAPAETAKFERDVNLSSLDLAGLRKGDVIHVKLADASGQAAKLYLTVTRPFEEFFESASVEFTDKTGKKYKKDLYAFKDEGAPDDDEIYYVNSPKRYSDSLRVGNRLRLRGGGTDSDFTLEGLMVSDIKNKSWPEESGENSPATTEMPTASPEPTPLSAAPAEPKPTTGDARLEDQKKKGFSLPWSRQRSEAVGESRPEIATAASAREKAQQFFGTKLSEASSEDIKASAFGEIRRYIDNLGAHLDEIKSQVELDTHFEMMSLMIDKMIGVSGCLPTSAEFLKLVGEGKPYKLPPNTPEEFVQLPDWMNERVSDVSLASFSRDQLLGLMQYYMINLRENLNSLGTSDAEFDVNYAFHRQIIRNIIQALVLKKE